MATPGQGKGQQETRLISQGTHKAEVVLITTYPNGKKKSQTKHYRIVGGQFTDSVKVTEGRDRMRENGRKPVGRRRAA